MGPHPALGAPFALGSGPPGFCFDAKRILIKHQRSQGLDSPSISQEQNASLPYRPAFTVSSGAAGAWPVSAKEERIMSRVKVCLEGTSWASIQNQESR